jgi:hypothetical protein
VWWVGVPTGLLGEKWTLRAGMHEQLLTSYMHVSQAALTDPGSLPHVSECSTCKHCWYTQDRDPQAIPPLPQHVNTTTGRRQLAAAINGMVPTDAGVRRRRQLPACEECWGCNTALQPLQAMVIAGHSLEADAGRTEAWVFLAGACDSLAQQLRPCI